ncbi:NAD-dependent epimerase/dehydratase family protein [Desulfoprunum benzoelyticum]|uniref:Nucleoside-diphosphate-sugar epimerase n=1 Tax=Desulfoprunum benzoelyticum TaxID=1506996 RepID=A0A840UYS6_9BACT|nr:NAD-dependent epimerase/dehydratase family protein [Desulfoprunum benzoelyticum]MBB5346599.1 nucleoside-diphosphate-sugar epimerase [Desulfoprunum benzoelyticum]MBM9528872.1 NAD-dependent epimerase/dehydratase family protein [Desulfoprunum benzoelyticum]
MNRALVTGGGGFVGQVIVRMLTQRGIACRVVGRHRYPEVEALGAESIPCDIRDREKLGSAFRDVDTVFHTASLAGIWGREEEYHSINVDGTLNVVQACRDHGVPRLVYTSTPSVVFARRDIAGGTEALPYATRFLCHYARTKATAERLVLAANGATLTTCALRPHLIWGPGDPHLIPRLVASGRQGLLKRVGDGANLVDISYVDNVAHAHLLAAANLEGEGSAAGRAYFISQGEPVVLWQWINSLFARLGIAKVTASVPLPLAYAVGAGLEILHKLVRPAVEPRMTRFLAEQLAKSHYFSIEQAKKDLGYAPIVSTAAGLDHLVSWIQAHEKIS